MPAGQPVNIDVFVVAMSFPIVLLLCSLALCEAIFLRQEMLRATTAPAEDPSYPERWFHDQTVDHFNSNDNRTFSQRYFANLDHYEPGGPVFINIGGEGPASSKDVSGYLTNALFAQKTKGAAISVEHRFYGKTQPVDSLETSALSLLTSRQALHDLAQFQTWLMAGSLFNNSKQVFCMGGSYPGNLAAWYRLEFPEMTAGCWSASGPVLAQEDWPGFGEKVWRAVATDNVGRVDESVSTKLYAGYQQLAGLIQDPTAEAHAALEKEFNVCPGTLASQGDRDNFEMSVTGYPGLIMQYNNTHEPKLGDIRKIVKEAETALSAAMQVSKFLNLTQGSPPANCTDNSIGSMYKLLQDTSLPANGMANPARTWFWQTCNEFGYFQSGTSKWDKPTLYTRAASARSLWQQVCTDVYGIPAEEIGARIAATNRYYGGNSPSLNISNVLFSNGDLDAWSLLSVTKYEQPNDREVYTEIAPLGSHCVGLYPPSENEVPGATRIRDKAFALFNKWGQ